MKKIKLFLAVTILTFISYSGYKVYDYSTTSTAEKLIKDNIQALTTTEGPNDGWIEDWWESKIYYCTPIKIWVTEYMQYKDVPRGDWEWTPTGPIDPYQWGWVTYLKDDFECVPGNSVAHCWEC